MAGSGAAGLVQGAITVITYTSPLEKRPLYIGLVVSCFGICACVSPIMGGALTDRVSWRWCFWMHVSRWRFISALNADFRSSNLPIGAAVFILIVFGLNPKIQDDPIRKLPVKEKLKELDAFGVVLLLGAFCCLFLSLKWGGIKYSWHSSKVICLLVGFGLLILTFGTWQWWFADKATIPPRILCQRTVLYGALSLFFI